MNNELSTVTERWVVDSFDTDALGEMRLNALVRRLQNTADLHARCHQLAVDQLLQTGRTWVLREFHLRVARVPLFQESCVVKTWASDRSAGVKAWRDFTVHANTGELLAVATSMWLMLDVARWKLIRLPDTVFGMVSDNQEPVLEPLPLPKDFVAEGDVYNADVHWLDLDFNGHVNNVRYLDWMMAAIPAEHCRKERVHELAVDFRGEARAGDQVHAAARLNGSSSAQHRISNGHGTLLVLASTNWRSRVSSEALSQSGG